MNHKLLPASFVLPVLALSLAAGCGGVIIDGTDDIDDPSNPQGPGPGSNGPGSTDHDPNKLFAASSPWNALAGGAVDPSSSLMVSSGQVGSLAAALTKTGRGLDIAGTDDYPDYGVPLFKVVRGTPMTAVQVLDKYGWWGGGFANVPMPAAATPAIGSDHHLSIWDVDNYTLYEFWEMQRNPNGTWQAGAGVKFDTRGTGYQTAPWAVSARAYGGAAIAGAILYEEMRAGVINHALGMAYPGTRGRHYAAGLGVDGITQNIASHSDNSPLAERNLSSNIPEGARLRLKSSVDVNARCGGNTACSVIGTALKKYGMYVVDTAAVSTLYAEVLTGTGRTWAGLLRVTDAQVWTAADFELLALPATLTAAP